MSPDEAALAALQSQDRFVLRRRHFALDIRYELVDSAGQPLLFIVRPRRLFRTFITAGLVLFTIFATLAGFVLGLVIAERIQPSSPAALMICASLALVGMVGGVLLVATTAANHDVLFYCDEARQNVFLQVLEHKTPLLLQADYTVLDSARQRLGIVHRRPLKGWFCESPDGEVLCSVWGRWGSAKKGYQLIAPWRERETPDNEAAIGPGDEQESQQAGEALDYERQVDLRQGFITRKFGPLDRFEINLSPDAACPLDRRLAIAIAVLLDATAK